MSGRYQQQKRSTIATADSQKPKRTRIGRNPDSDPNLIKTIYNVERIDEIYSNLKKSLTKAKDEKDFLDISVEMKNEIFGYRYIPAENDNNLKNFEVLLAILRYLSRTKRPYNKKRIELLKQFLQTLEGESITNIFKSASYSTTNRIHITINDINYFRQAGEYLHKIADKFNVNTTFFSHNNDETYMKDPFIISRKYYVYFMCNTLVLILINNILTKNFNSRSRDKSETPSPKAK